MARQTKGSLYRRGETWWGKWYVGGACCRESLGTTVREDAERELARRTGFLAAADVAEKARRLADRAAGLERQADELKPEPEIPKTPLAEVWPRFLEDPTRPQSGAVALRDYGQRWGKLLKWAEVAGVVTVEDLTADRVAEFARTLADLSPNRFNKVIQTCRLVCRIVRPDSPNPFGKVAHKSLRTVGRAELSEEELRRVCRSAKGELRTLLAVGLFTALRLHDAIALDWGKVNLRDGVISLVPHKTARTEKGVVIPIADPLRRILEETPTDARTGAVVPGLKGLYERDTRAVARLLRAHFEACKVQTRQAGKGRNAVPFKSYGSLRHSFVSLSARMRTPLAVVQSLCGHGSPAIQRHYLHVGVDEARTAVGLLPDPLARKKKALPAPGTDPAAKLTAIARLVEGARGKLAESIRGILAG